MAQLISVLVTIVISLASVAQAEAWPEDKINNFFGYEISVPSVPGVTEYYWTTATNSEDAAITFTSETDVKDTYLQTLTDAGWVYEYIESDTSLGYEIGDYYLATNVNYQLSKRRCYVLFRRRNILYSTYCT